MPVPPWSGSHGWEDRPLASGSIPGLAWLGRRLLASGRRGRVVGDCLGPRIDEDQLVVLVRVGRVEVRRSVEESDERPRLAGVNSALPACEPLISPYGPDGFGGAGHGKLDPALSVFSYVRAIGADLDEDVPWVGDRRCDTEVTPGSLDQVGGSLGGGNAEAVHRLRREADSDGEEGPVEPVLVAKFARLREGHGLVGVARDLVDVAAKLSALGLPEPLEGGATGGSVEPRHEPHGEEERVLAEAG